LIKPNRVFNDELKLHLNSVNKKALVYKPEPWYRGSEYQLRRKSRCSWQCFYPTAD